MDGQCELYEQFEASITRLYHTIEKGLAYENYRPGFGRSNIDELVNTLEQYERKGFDTSAFFYETALSCLKEYIKKNNEWGYYDEPLTERVAGLKGKANDFGGTITVSKPDNNAILSYKELMNARHSIRHFSNVPVDMDKIKAAISLAQCTPSACNRQAWKTWIINDKEKIEKILANQNGNRGFGHEFDKLLLITADLRMQQKSREVFQAFIDGGMYAESVLNSLYYYGVGSVPLSASLTLKQESIIRSTVGLDKAEVMILFIGVGNYPDGTFLTARSERRPSEAVEL